STVTNKTSYQYGEEVTLSYTIKDGYTFKDITGDKTESTFTMPASNVSITINTTEDTYTITYILDGGTATNPTSYKVTTNDITLNNPTKDGYTFNGWTGSNGETADKNVTIAQGSTGNKTYTANFNPNTYTVTFDANGGSEVSTVLTVTYDATYGDTLPVPTRSGYTFGGWYTEETGGTKVESTTKVAITANQTLYAHWTAKSYTVTLSAGTGGKVSATSISVNYGGTNTFTVTPNSGYYLKSISCTNGYTTDAQTGKNQTAAQTVTVSNNNKDSVSTCTASFDQTIVNIVTQITNLVETDTTNLAYDGTTDNNLRYIGANPNNYVTFNGELWRIIGVMNNITDASGSKASHVKIIRAEIIGDESTKYFRWYSNSETNDWTKSHMRNSLNSGAYWNRTNGACTIASNGSTINCDLSSIGLTNDAKTMITNVVWNIGGHSTTAATASTFYTAERGTIVHSGNPTTWTGYVGLMYPSDYGFAVGGNVRSTCLMTNLADIWDNDCFTNDWLRPNNGNEWTITHKSDTTINVFYLTKYSGLSYAQQTNTFYIRPAVYLNSNIKIVSGSGTKNDPYVLSK
ncbi:MAG: InlB B-repeat-containing protein, partial [Bacilli bacterium]|nr:InlB B-repeat-containing protein [Bacilli bacterium]